MTQPMGMPISDIVAARPPPSADAAPAQSLLSIRNLTVRFGGVVALDNVSFDVRRGEICGLIGPNGAGKTTLFNCLSRLYRAESGEIRFEGEAIERLAKHTVARLGVARTFQNLALFDTMTTLENVMVGAHAFSHGGFLVNALGQGGREERRIRERAMALVSEFGLTSVAATLVRELPFGTRKRVELARALALEPKLLLLDEPAAGLNHQEVDGLRDEIQAIRDRRGVSILLVEHHMGLVMRVCDQVVALDFGRVIADGPPEQVRSNTDVVRAYLGDAA